MNNTASLTSLRTNAPLRHLAILGIGALLWLMAAFGWALVATYGEFHGLAVETPSRFQIVTAYLLPIAALASSGILVRIARQGRELSVRRFWFGCGLIVGAAAMDLGVTFYFSPDLMDEGNPVVVALMDSGHPLPWVIAHMLLTTLAIVGMFCAFWAAFLCHQPYLLEVIREESPANCTGFLKAATGGAHLSLRQWMFPCKISELPRLYHGIWMVGISIVFGISLFRYYVALEWLGVFHPALWPRMIALFTGVTGSLVWYFAILYRDYQHSLPCEIAVNPNNEF
jgi:hypothetical protein